MYNLTPLNNNNTHFRIEILTLSLFFGFAIFNLREKELYDKQKEEKNDEIFW